MRKTTGRILGMLLTVAALSAATPKAEAAKTACTLFCIQGYHCCVQGNTQSCIPQTEACPR
jgi:uncharacterized membrane protein